MKIPILKSLLPSPELTLRRVGYALITNRRGATKSFVRRLDRDQFPRFHLYVEDYGDSWSLNLHLDQRAPIYQGVTAHGGEYDGSVVEREAARIKQLLGI